MSNKNPFELQTYNHEEIIVYDDKIPTLDEFIEVTNLYRTPTQTYGASRYNSNWWKLGQIRRVIWLLNPERLPEYARPDNKRYEIFKSRFQIYGWNNARQAFEVWEDTPSVGAEFVNGAMVIHNWGPNEMN